MVPTKFIVGLCLFMVIIAAAVILHYSTEQKFAVFFHGLVVVMVIALIVAIVKIYRYGKNSDEIPVTVQKKIVLNQCPDYWTNVGGKCVSMIDATKFVNHQAGTAALASREGTEASDETTAVGTRYSTSGTSDASANTRKVVKPLSFNLAEFNKVESNSDLCKRAAYFPWVEARNKCYTTDSEFWKSYAGVDYFASLNDKLDQS
jgi:hypothetical protein